LLIILGVIFTLGIFIAYLNVQIDSQSKKIFVFGILFFLIFVLPSLFVRIQADDGEFNYIDCRIYLPLVGFLTSIGVLLQKILPRINKKIIFTSFILLLTYTLIFSVKANQSYKNGEAFWNTVIANHPHRAAYWIGLGTYYFNKQDFNKAVQFGEKAISINPKIPEYYYKTATAYIQNEDNYSAIKTIKKVLAIEFNKPRALFNLIQLYFQVGDLINAEEATNELLDIEIEKRQTKYIFLTSQYYSQKKLTVQAINLLKTCIDLDPQNAHFHTDLGKLFYTLGDFTSAKMCFYTAWQLDPNNLEYVNNLNLF
jgi:tetratricopeptide (TPR) repeat protein